MKRIIGCEAFILMGLVIESAASATFVLALTGTVTTVDRGHVALFVSSCEAKKRRRNRYENIA